jgi:hypothetical protein
MSGDRHVDIYIPVGPGSDTGYRGIGVIGTMAGFFAGVVGFALCVCVVVSCADFGDGAQIPASSCDPFCAATSAVHPAEVGEATR